jgi:threonine dehydratase
LLVNWQERVIGAAERIRPLVRETPVELSAFSLGTSTQLFLKLEHLQHTGSFKFRGASNKISLLTPNEAAAGVITASNGNHGLAVAAAASAKGIDAEVYVSSKVSRSKLHRIQQYGASIREIGDDPLEAELAAREATVSSGRVFISPYNDPDVIAGQGTIALELHQQLRDIDAIFVAAGGGGLIGGIGAYMKAASPKTEIIGCWPENSPVLYRCLEAGRILNVPEQPTLSESTAGGLEPGSITIDLCRAVVDRAVLVSESEILAAMRRSLEEDHWLIEGAAGVALAAYLREAKLYADKTAVVVICGRNLSTEVLHTLI